MGSEESVSKNHILVVHEGDNKPLQELSTTLQNTGLYHLTFMPSHKLLRKPTETEHVFKAAIFDCAHLNKREFVGVKRTTELIRFAPTLVLASQISLFSYRRIDILKNTLTVQKPCDIKVTLSLIDRMIHSPDYKPTRSPRFITDMPVRLMHLKTGLLVPTRMRNYSASGAFFEYKGLAFKVGDPIEINLDLEDQSAFEESLKMRAKVVWLHEGEAARSAVRGIGVQFITPSL